jgi:hypothetical protein
MKIRKVNYRISHQIRIADRQLGPEVFDADGNADERRDAISVFNGPPPDIGHPSSPLLLSVSSRIMRAGERIMITMPKELQEVIRASHGQPVRLADPDTHQEYIVLRAEIYDQIQTRIYDDTLLTTEEKQALLIEAGLRAGWDDPEMDVYNELDPRKPS